ncbi:28S ribosomal protein S28, mitochondrial [Condylostylus longicornis]|uniref:28S ribosomal protein S28, mitochondrial n=1 Tax=Condylostylus longicornis TaxID=2530218 RepID=UPI00244DBC76|nr:28S ribosomal protein S28, mitochondrial [Condylostylus longicornis]
MGIVKLMSVRTCSKNFFESFLRSYCTNPISGISSNVTESNTEKGGFAKAFERHSKPIEQEVSKEPSQTFASLLRNSKFIDLGDPEGKIVTGTIYHVVGDDLYIDFGWKFHCVCQRPNRNGSDYVRGSKVRLRIKDLELSTKFLGSTKDLTILEADCQLLGLTYSPARSSRNQLKENE